MTVMIRTIKQDFERAFSTNFIIAILSVVLLMLMDNAWELKNAFGREGYTVYYFLFNTIVFSGMLGTYGTPVACSIPYCSSIIQEIQDGVFGQFFSRSGENRYVLSKFLTAAFSSGLCMSTGYWLFIAILILIFPFTGPSIMESGMIVFPYTDISQQGNIWIHIIIILYFGFWTGVLYGGITIMLSSFFKHRLIVYSIPFILRFSWIQLYRIIPVEYHYRLDYWLFMRTMYVSPSTTMLLCAVRISLLLLLSYFVLLKKVKGA